VKIKRNTWKGTLKNLLLEAYPLLDSGSQEFMAKITDYLIKNSSELCFILRGIGLDKEKCQYGEGFKAQIY
jgi:hypothetical protein